MATGQPAQDPGVLALLGEAPRYGRYVLVRPLAQGGMAQVFLARREGEAPPAGLVALKVIHPLLAADPAFARKFAAEARLAARIHHPNVCAVVDFGEAHGGSYLVMEYLRGASLLEVVQRARALPIEVACRVVADAARGLHAAHELRTPDGASAAVVHRDVSPSNLFVQYDGVTKVVDFGVARSRDAAAREEGEITATNALQGKPAYMSPEQIAIEPLDRRTDVFALGVVLWETTVGQRLYQRASDYATMAAICEQPARAPSSVRAGYPRPLEQIVLRALARERDARFATAAAMADALEAFLAARGAPAGPEPVAAFMRALFADRLPDEHGADAGASPVVAAQTVTVTVPPAPPATVARDAGPAAADHVVVGDDDDTVRAPPRGRRGRRVAAALAGLGAIGVAALVVAPRHAVRAPAPHTAIAPPPPPPQAPAPAPMRERVEPVQAPQPAITAPAPVAAPATPPAATTSSRAPRAAPTPPAWGEVNVMAWPASADVFEGAQRLGTTPLARMRLTAGRHVLRLVPRNGTPPRRVVVEVRPHALSIVHERW